MKNKQLFIVTLLVCLSTNNIYSADVCPKKEYDEYGNLIKDYCGEKVGEIELPDSEKVGIFCNGDNHTTEFSCKGEDQKEYGLEFQCVELVKRFYAQRFNVDVKSYCWKGNAITYYRDADGLPYLSLRGLAVADNGSSSTPPRTNDIMVFQAGEDDKVGHVAIVTNGVIGDLDEGASTTIEVAEQNLSRKRVIDTIHVSKQNNYYEATRENNSQFEVKGWARLTQGPILPSKDFHNDSEVALTEDDVGVRPGDKAALNVRRSDHVAGDPTP